jgi:alpha-N-acetylglucosaminidase
MAWNFMLNATIANPGLLDVPTYHNDMVDVTRQVFANAFIGLYNSTISAWEAGNITGVESSATKLIDFLMDLDEMLGTDPSFILGKWIGDARRWSDDNDTYADFLEYNARNQVGCLPPVCSESMLMWKITLWGPTGQINDYASKQWSGLIETYYIPRFPPNLLLSALLIVDGGSLYSILRRQRRQNLTQPTCGRNYRRLRRGGRLPSGA